MIEKALECLRDLCEELGPDAVEKHLDAVIHHLTLLLEKQAYCQTHVLQGEDKKEEGEGSGEDAEVSSGSEGEFEDEKSESDDEHEHDEVILGNTCDALDGLASACGDGFL